MANKLIYKVKKNSEDSINIYTKYTIYGICTVKTFYRTLNILGTLYAAPSNIDNLYELVLSGFKFSLYETENSYNLIVYKNKSSISFTSSKDRGTANVLIQAEEWAKTFLEENKKTNIL